MHDSTSFLHESGTKSIFIFELTQSHGHNAVTHSSRWNIRRRRHQDATNRACDAKHFDPLRTVPGFQPPWGITLELLSRDSNCVTLGGPRVLLAHK